MTSSCLFCLRYTFLKKNDNDISKFLKRHADLLGKGYFNRKLYLTDWFPRAILSDGNLECFL